MFLALLEKVYQSPPEKLRECLSLISILIKQMDIPFVCDQIFDDLDPQDKFKLLAYSHFYALSSDCIPLTCRVLTKTLKEHDEWCRIIESSLVKPEDRERFAINLPFDLTSESIQTKLWDFSNFFFREEFLFKYIDRNNVFFAAVLQQHALMILCWIASSSLPGDLIDRQSFLSKLDDLFTSNPSFAKALTNDFLKEMEGTTFIHQYVEKLEGLDLKALKMDIQHLRNQAIEKLNCKTETSSEKEL